MKSRSREPDEPSVPCAARRPYSPPRIEESGRFEQLVLACTFNDRDCQPTGDPDEPPPVPRSL